ncbi:MAG: HAD-IIIA family hydrolase [Candidatus Omnitrophica bacterium]|nr:HAD-IIIA family hydrolase [Candidatus Omnitrophota bacterium]
MKAKAVFFDRDGVLIKAVIRDHKPFAIHSADEFCLTEGAQEAVQQLAAADYRLFIISNQPDLARGTLAHGFVSETNQKLVGLLGGSAMIRAVYVCPHDNSHRCECRKPRPGMLLQAAKEWDVDLARSFVIGDRDVDMAAGKAAGCSTIVMNAPYNGSVMADYRASDLKDASRWILKNLCR